MATVRPTAAAAHQGRPYTSWGEALRVARQRATLRHVGLRVVIADDHALVRDGIASLLATTPDIEVAGMASDLHQLLEVVGEVEPDVVVTDIRMPPDGSDEGIRFAATLRDTSPQVGVVVLSQHADPAYALALLERGSDRRAYLLKDRVSNRAELLAAIRAVAGGGSMIDPKIVEGLVAARARADHSPLNQLTPREHEVLAEIAQGKSNAAIGETLFLTKRAVEKHINSIFLKLGLAESEDVSKRVKAALLLLADEADRTPAGSHGST
jgi:DNA-binding NarL/FixJ family response regulator